MHFANRRLALAVGLVLAFSAQLLLTGGASSQTQSQSERFREMSTKAEKAGLAEPFKGITADGQVETGLFSIRSTGVSTEPVRKAAEAFLAGLTPAQREKTMFPLDDPEWRKWMNQHFYVRQGVSFNEMSEPQRDLGLALLKAALSARGLTQTRDIMRLNYTLGELNNNDFDQYGEWRYHLTVMGKPSSTEPWGWQFDGHHAIINYFVLGEQVVMTPFFAGSEPVIAPSGKYKDTAVLQEEQKGGLTMINALTSEQRQAAVIQVAKTGNNNLTEAFKDNVVLDYAGVRATALTDPQRQQLLDLIALYVGNMDDGHARVKMEDVRKYLDRTFFAWIGGMAPDSVFYYRIHSPVILIEFDHQLPANLKQLAANPSLPNHEHIHVVVRTPNGNDYGKDLLREHYRLHPHSTADGAAR
ncbi:MAG TPA: DUF3500 domain-containing protein [Vicinamibacterales bacterium]|nr:DUF3500 domain-containing protein [Vicinamibacterales bacterium]